MGLLLENLLVSGKTISGKEIMLEKTSDENWLRQKASQVQSYFKWQFLDDHFSGDTLSDTIVIFRREASNPKHFGAAKPGRNSSSGIPLLPNPKFNYWDFFGFAISGYDDGYAGFSRDLRLPPRVTYRIAVGAIGLLLVDSAIEHLEAGRGFQSAADIADAYEAFHEMLVPLLSAEIRNESREGMRKGGRERHRETEGYRPSVIAEWQTGKYKTKAALANWATKNYPIDSETAKRWIRKHEKTTT